MAEVKKKKIEEFIEAVRGANTVIRKMASQKLDRVRCGKKLKREWENYNNKAYEIALEIEVQCQRAICAEDLIELAGIVYRTTNAPLERFSNILALLDIAIVE